MYLALTPSLVSTSEKLCGSANVNNRRKCHLSAMMHSASRYNNIPFVVLRTLVASLRPPLPRPSPCSLVAGTCQTASGVVRGGEDDTVLGGLDQEYVDPAGHDRKFDTISFARARG